jgi:hypothetical protein
MANRLTGPPTTADAVEDSSGAVEFADSQFDKTAELDSLAWAVDTRMAW